MSGSFADILKNLRLKRNLSQQQLANQLFVDRSSIAHWENGKRMPDAAIIYRLAQCLGVEVSVLLDSAAADAAGCPTVMIVDDEDLLIAGAMPVLAETMPGASIVGFTRVSEALAYARKTRVSIAFLDIEIGRSSGFDLCKQLMEIHPQTNVIFLTSYPDYAISAWDTPASGFLLKPLCAEDIEQQLLKLRHPVWGLK